MTPEIITVDPRSDSRWRHLATSPAGSLFTSPPWISAVCDTYGFDPRARVGLGEDRSPSFGMAWVDVDDLRGRRQLSLPFCDRADPIVTDLQTWQNLVDDVLDDGATFTVRALDPTPVADDPRFQVAGEAAWHGTPLGNSTDELQQRLSSHARRNIKVAQKHGVRVEVRPDLDAVRAFHSLHVQLRKRKYQLLAQPLELFERIWAAFSADDAVHTVLAYEGDQLIAGSMYLEWNGVLYYKFGASLSEHLSSRPNELITWNAMCHGIERGLRLLVWGLSDLDQPGLVAYKRKWASDERRILTLRRPAPVPAPPNDAGRVLGELTRLLTDERVPDDISVEAGALLYRYFC